MTPIAVNPDTLPAPNGYSHGTLVGNTLHLGGQTALDADMKIVPGGIVEQRRSARSGASSQGPSIRAMTGIGCTSLWQPEAVIEILGVAVIPEGGLTVSRV